MNILDFKIIKIEVFNARVISTLEHLRYMIFWILGRDYYVPVADDKGNNLRVTITHSDQ